jgi:hypothetical protein
MLLSESVSTTACHEKYQNVSVFCFLSLKEINKYLEGHMYNETKMMHFSLIFLRINGVYMFRVLLAHPQEALHKLHLVCCVRVMSVGCGTDSQQTCLSQLTLYARNILNVVCSSPPEDEQVMLETRTGTLILNKLNKKYITLVSLTLSEPN